jgi:hypothetical protein
LYAYDASSLNSNDHASSVDSSDDTTSPASNLSRDLPPLYYPDSDDNSESDDDMPPLAYRYSGYESSDDNISISSEPGSSHQVFSAPAPEAVPIRVSPKPPKGKRRKNAFIDDRGFPDQSDELDTLLHSMHGEPILRISGVIPLPISTILILFSISNTTTPSMAINFVRISRPRLASLLLRMSL